MRKGNKMNGLFFNTLMLYVLTFSNYFFNFITVPFQTRIFGAEVYGNLGFATSVMTYFQLIFDFGFLLSATEEVAENRDDKNTLSKIVEKVYICKTGLIMVSGIVLLILCLKVERFHDDWLLFTLYFISTAIYAYIPDFLYRGIEEMKVITIRSVSIKLFFTIMIFVLLRDKSQYYLVPILNILGNLGAMVGIIWHLYCKIGIRPIKISMEEIKEEFKRSSTFFYSRIASTIYTTTNTFILGIMYGQSAAVVGYYSSADKLITTGKQAITPVTDSLYPYMIKNRDFKLIKKLLIIGMPILTAGCILVAVLAEWICTILFGAEFEQAGQYLRLLVPVVWCSFPAMLFGFPVLSPMGLTRWANYSNMFGACIQIILLLFCYFWGQLSIVSICICTCITEFMTLIFRVTTVLVNRRKL